MFMHMDINSLLNRVGALRHHVVVDACTSFGDHQCTNIHRFEIIDLC